MFSPKPSQFWHLHFCTFDISKNHPKVCNVCETFKKIIMISLFYHDHGQSIEHLYILCKDVRAERKIFDYFSGSSILLLIQWNTGQAGLSNKSKAKSQKSTSEVKVSSSSRGWKCGNGGSCWALFRVPSLGGWLWGVVGGAVGFTEEALFEYQLPLVCDQLSLTCEGWNVVNILLSQEKISRQCISSLGQTNCFFFQALF